MKWTRATLLALGLLTACADSPPPRTATTTDPVEEDEVALRQPNAQELEELRELAELILVGRVEERVAQPGGVSYRVRVLEVVSENPILQKGDSHPYDRGQELEITAFLYRGSRSPTSTRFSPSG